LRASSSALLPNTGSELISLFVSVDDALALPVSRRGDSAVTVIASLMLPTSRTTGTSTRELTVTCSPVRVYFLNPSTDTVIRYGPGIRYVTSNAPRSLLTVSFETFVSSLVTTMAAPGRTPPEASCTEPNRDERVSWPAAAAATAFSSRMMAGRDNTRRGHDNVPVMARPFYRWGESRQSIQIQR
jgi:hypothetical protein